VKSFKLAPLAVALVALTSGCKTLYQETSHDDFYEVEVSERAFLGIVVKKDWISEEGVGVVRVLKDSPAAKAGIRPGDVIVTYGASRASSTSALAKAIVELGSSEQVEVGVRSGGLQILSITPTRERKYGEHANEALDSKKSSTRIPFLFQAVDYDVDPDLWLAYTGYRMPQGAEAYSEINILPIFSFSLFRVEDTDLVCDAARVQILHWPLIITTGQTKDEELQNLRDSFRSSYERL
jgi:membrane-associated protease RseP (regulator of RpoE activity)